MSGGSSEKRFFYASFPRMYIATMPVPLLLGLILSPDLPPRVGFAGALAGWGLVTLAAILMWPVQVYPWGIKTATGIGTVLSLRWEEMGIAKRSLPWPLVPYVLVASTRHDPGNFTVQGWLGSAQTIPLFLMGQERFRLAVLELAPAGNPLREFLRQGDDVVPNRHARFAPPPVAPSSVEPVRVERPQQDS